MCPLIPNDEESMSDILDRAALAMAEQIVIAYETKSRFGYKSLSEPLARVNRIMDWADSRDRVVEQCALIRDDMEEAVRMLWPCKDHRPPHMDVFRSLMDKWVIQLTEVLVDATGD